MEEPEVSGCESLAPPWCPGLKTTQQATASPYDYVKAGLAVSFFSVDLTEVMMMISGSRQGSLPRSDPHTPQ